MLRISEWLPNPEGSDMAEWIELWNDGTDPLGLSGWSVRTSKGKPAKLAGTIAPGEYKVLQRADLKLVLRNEDESLSLVSPDGRIVSESRFYGTAPAGKSVVLLEGRSFFAKPTPGAKNLASETRLINNAYPWGTPLRGDVSVWFIISAGLLVALALALGVLLTIKKNNDLQELFFGTN